MEDVWRREPATVREVMEAINENAPERRAYTTVMKIMDRLHRKGLLDRRSERNTYIYTPRLARDEYADARAQAEVDALVREWGDVALVHFAKQMGTLDPKRREQLRRLARGA
ncbi:MAG: BlaI/MecI/CopY family transcriptional regulator [Actinomycetota bacterium]|nr:BlaI/MecI/CopY family transcriptional regulator [Actinomycetota bacterium]